MVTTKRPHFNIEKLEDIEHYITKYLKVLTKSDEDELPRLVPMKLWPSQRHYLANRTKRDIVLKSRQTGFSTGILAINAHSLFTTPYQRQTIITHDQETSEFLLVTIQRFLKNLPEELRPKTDWKSGSRMRFPGLDSYIYIDSAKSDSIGIGHTINRCHLSEVAKWPPRRATPLFNDISQTVPEHGYLVLESTPKGKVGLFAELYHRAKHNEIPYKAFFYPWWWDITCIRKPEGKMEYSNEEKMLVASFGLSPSQIAFRREKLAELKDYFYQEYPENDVDCFLTSDIAVFDGVAIRNYLQQAKDGITQGHLTIWQDVLGGERYVIGVDVAGGREKGDWSVASVLKVKTNEYVARLRAKIPPDFFAEELLKLGARFNGAEIAVERTGHGHVVLKVLLDNSYPNLYYHTDYDMVLNENTTDAGWKTTSKSKPIMIETFAAHLRSSAFVSWSRNLMDEASNVYFDGEKIETYSGSYDDELVAVEIALQLRENAPIIEAQRRQPRAYMEL